MEKLKNYTITVNGVAYDVTVEERVGGAAPAPAAALHLRQHPRPRQRLRLQRHTRTCGSTCARTRSFRSRGKRYR